MWQILKKDLRIFFSDRKALFLALLLPVGLITLFAFAFGGVANDDESDASPVHVLFTDADQTDASKNIIAQLDSIPGLEFTATTKDEALQKIKSGDEIAAVIISKGFSDSLSEGNNIPVELLFDQSRSMEVSILQNLLVGKLSEVSGEVNKNRGIGLMVQNLFPMMPQSSKDTMTQTFIRQSEAAEKETSLVTMTSVVGDAESNWGLIQAVAGTAIMMLLFSVSALGQSLLEEKENGVLKKLLQSPLHPSSIMFGKMLTSTVVAIFQLTVMFVFAWLAFGLNIFINLPALFIMILATALACSAFGVFLSSIVTTKKQADSLGTILILFMSGIGGSMIPLYIMPQFMQNIAVVTVNYWSIQGFYDIFWRKEGLGAIGENVIVLLGITTGVLLISNFLFKKNIIKLS